VWPEGTEFVRNENHFLVLPGFAGAEFQLARRAKENSPAIYRWYGRHRQSPAGTTGHLLEREKAMRDFLRPYGTFFVFGGDPAMNRWAIFGASLPDFGQEFRYFWPDRLVTA
jgi:hypothetical protein